MAKINFNFKSLVELINTITPTFFIYLHKLDNNINI